MTRDTRGGTPFRVICTDAKGDHGCVVALLNHAGIEVVYRFNSAGTSGAHRALDLVKEKVTT